MKLFHVLDSGIFPYNWLIDEFFPLVDEMKKAAESGTLKPVLSGKLMIGIFQRPSLQTRFAAETAMQRLGGKVAETGPDQKNLAAVINIVPDIIILRADRDGGALEAAEISPRIPIINCGEEFGDHPTQALTDSYTIWEKLGRLTDFSIVISGELNRIGAARAITSLLTNCPNVKFYFVFPPVIKWPYESSDLCEVVADVDVVYQIPIPEARLSILNSHGQCGAMMVTAEMLGSMRKESVILNPLPRRENPPPEIIKVDSDPRAAYFEQAENAQYVWMALLKIIFAP